MFYVRFKKKLSIGFIFFYHIPGCKSFANMNARQKYEIFIEYSLSVKSTFENDVPFLLSFIALDSKHLNNNSMQRNIKVNYLNEI